MNKDLENNYGIKLFCDITPDIMIEAIEDMVADFENKEVLPEENKKEREILDNWLDLMKKYRDNVKDKKPDVAKIYMANSGLCLLAEMLSEAESKAIDDELEQPDAELKTLEDCIRSLESTWHDLAISTVYASIAGSMFGYKFDINFEQVLTKNHCDMYKRKLVLPEETMQLIDQVLGAEDKNNAEAFEDIMGEHFSTFDALMER